MKRTQFVALSSIALISAAVLVSAGSARAEETTATNSPLITVAAEKDQWQSSGLMLLADEEAIITVPEMKVAGTDRTDVQSWGIIDPDKRGFRPYWGGDVEAGDTFVLPSTSDRKVMEGSLLVRVRDGEAVSQVQSFSKEHRDIYVKGPGQIEFIANDAIRCKWGRLLFNCHLAGKDNGFVDNKGQLKVKILVAKQPSASHPMP